MSGFEVDLRCNIVTDDEKTWRINFDISGFPDEQFAEMFALWIRTSLLERLGEIGGVHDPTGSQTTRRRRQ